jgi:hypothetical protein
LSNPDTCFFSSLGSFFAPHLILLWHHTAHHDSCSQSRTSGDCDPCEECPFLLITVSFTSAPVWQGCSVDDYPIVFLISMSCVASGWKWPKNCESENLGCLMEIVVFPIHCIKIYYHTKRKKIQSGVEIKGILLWHCIQWSLKENDLLKS